MKKKLELPTSVADIDTTIAKLRIALHDIGTGTMSGKHKNVHESRRIKKDIARLMTEKTKLSV